MPPRLLARGAAACFVSTLFVLFAFFATASLAACVGVTEGALDDERDGGMGSEVGVDGAVTPPIDSGTSPAEVGADTGVASDAREPSDTGTTGDATPIDPVGPTGLPRLVVGKITGAEPTELTMIADGVALANATMATACFHDYVLSASWTETLGLGPAQIWDKLCSGPISVDVDMYTGSWYENHVTHTVGYENEPGTVHMNRYYVDTAYMVADNLIHEGEGHSQGFRHDGVKATSVPYGLNAAFEACSPTKP